MAADTKAIVELARKRYKRAVDGHTSRDSQIDDVKFAAGSPDNQWQWDPLALQNRKADPNSVRPILTFNQLPQHIRQVTNEQRQNRPSGKVLPVDDKADPKVAAVYNGIIRHIEVSSDADIALDTACDAQVTQGEGFFRVVAEWCDPKSFDQDLRLKAIRNAFAVEMDPDIQEPTGEDAKFCFIGAEYTKEEFEEEFPDAEPVSWQPSQRSAELSPWHTDSNKIRVQEYYRVEHETVTLNLWADGTVTMKGEPAEQRYAGQTPVKTRPSRVPKVIWCKTNGYQILGPEKVVPGKRIPVFRVVGNEWIVDGDVVVSGIVRNAKDPQRMVNYWASQEAEMLALAPKAPFVGYSGQFEGFESKWRNANVVNYPYLEVKPVVDDASGAVLPLPQRMAPPMPPAGIIEAKMQALDAVKQTTGQYNPSLGAASNETSGKAIIARQRESDVGTYHYVDNLARAVRAWVRYAVDVIPVYYDARKVARILGEDGTTTDYARLDPTMQEAYRETQDASGAIQKIYNLTVGKYDVVSSVGPSYTTKRLEAVDAMTQLLQGNAEMWGVFGDLLVKNMDWPGAEEIAERIRRTIPPQILGDDKGGGDPKLAQAMQLVEQLTGALEEARNSIEQQKVEIQAFDAETKRITAIAKSLTTDQIQDVVLGTLAAVMTSSDIDPGDAAAPAPGGMPPPQPEAPQPGAPMQ